MRRRHSERHCLRCLKFPKPTDLINPSCSAKAQATPCVATYIYRTYIYRNIKLYTRTLHTSAGIFAQAPGPGYRVHNHRMASSLLCPAVLCIEYRRAGKLHHVFIAYTVVGEKVVGLKIFRGRWQPVTSWSGWMHNEWRGAVQGGSPQFAYGVHYQGNTAKMIDMVIRDIVPVRAGRSQGVALHFSKWIQVDLFMTTKTMRQRQLPPPEDWVVVESPPINCHNTCRS